MELANVKKQLIRLTEGLLYSSESDYPWMLEEPGNKSPTAIQQWISARHRGEIAHALNAEDFFNRYIERLKKSGDKAMLADTDRYAQLLQFLKINTAKLQAWKCGNIQVGIYLILTIKDSRQLVLHTTSIET
jgi:hypothetical protein